MLVCVDLKSSSTQGPKVLPVFSIEDSAYRLEEDKAGDKQMSHVPTHLFTFPV